MKRFLRCICCILVLSLLMTPLALATDFETPPDDFYDDDVWSNPFTDVKSSMWSYSGIEFVCQRGLFSGMNETTFEPKTAMNRAMLVSVLWRYEGSPEGDTQSFSDVSNKQWYAKGIAWAAAKGIVSGTGNNCFSPNGLITREQMAVILYNYSKYKGVNVSAAANLNAFPDANKVSSWAQTAMKWAVAEGLISGTTKDGKTVIDPKGNATREQVASILMRYILNVMEHL